MEAAYLVYSSYIAALGGKLHRARQGHVELVNMEPFMEVYENTWQTLNSLLSRVG